MCVLFYGTFTPKLDDKGRMFLPAKFREAMAPGCVATLGFDRTVAIYPIAAFEEINSAVSALPVTVQANRDFARMFRANAHDQTPDKQGRIALHPTFASTRGWTRSWWSTARASSSRFGTPVNGSATATRNKMASRR